MYWGYLKYEYLLKEWDDPDFSFFELKIQKYLDTSLIDVNINPNWVSVRIKGKLTQIKLQDEIIVEKSSVQRSQITSIAETHTELFVERTLQTEEQKKKK